MPYQDEISKKWGYFVFYKEKGNPRLLLSCNPVYDSEDLAKIEGEKLIMEMREKDLSSRL